MMSQAEIDKILSDLYEEAEKAGPGSIFNKLLKLFIDTEFRLRDIEAKITTPIYPVFSPQQIPFSPFFGLPHKLPDAPSVERIGEQKSVPIQEDCENKDDVYLHLLKEGYGKADASEIAKEIAEVIHGPKI
jgi:hypothetical protein